MIVRPQQGENHCDRNDDHTRRHRNHEAADQRDQKRPETALEVFAEVVEIEIGERLRPLVVASPETGDQPTFDDDRPDERDENADTPEQRVHHPLRTLEVIADGSGVVHGKRERREARKNKCPKRRSAVNRKRNLRLRCDGCGRALVDAQG